MKLKPWLMLAMILPICSACTTRVVVTEKDWCLNDKWICWNDQDASRTIKQVDDHNAGYEKACPKQPHVCK